MNRVAVFGRPGGGKSTFSKRLASLTQVELFALDTIEYLEGGARVPADEFAEKHDAILNRQQWIIDGLGTLDSFNKRLESADTLIYIKLPAYLHYWFVIKRFLKSPWQAPEGYPKRSPMIRSTLTSFINLSHSDMLWTKDFEARLQALSVEKSIVFIHSLKEMNDFLQTLKPSTQETGDLSS